MSWNIRHGYGNDDRIDLARIADVIRESGASIVGLQEVDRDGERSGRIDQAAALAERLGMSAHFAPNAEFHPATAEFGPHLYGVAILTSLPVRRIEHRLLVNSPGWEQRGALAVSVELVPGIELSLVNTHLQWADGEDVAEASALQRGQQLVEVMRLAAEWDQPAVVMGDFNSLPGSPEMASIEARDSGFVDAWSTAGSAGDGFTFPASPTEDANTRIDYIWVTTGIAVQRCEVVKSDLTRMATDHYPVVADLELRHRALTPAARQDD